MPTYTKEQITKLCSIKNEKARLFVAEYLDTLAYYELAKEALLDTFLAFEEVYYPNQPKPYVYHDNNPIVVSGTKRDPLEGLYNPPEDPA